jgi:hypothetical protein
MAGMDLIFPMEKLISKFPNQKILQALHLKNASPLSKQAVPNLPGRKNKTEVWI